VPEKVRREEKETLMLPKLSLSLMTALVLSVVASRAAHAAPMDTAGGNAAIDAAESGNPHSVDYPNRTFPSHSPTNDEINAAETGTPQSLDYSHRPALPQDGNTNADWQSSESVDPDMP
jgi:hypothetical protein